MASTERRSTWPIKSLLENHPKDEAACLTLVARGRAALRQGHFAQALNDGRRACQLNATCVEALYLCGSAHAKQGQLDQAITLYSKVLQLQPGHAKAALSRGACLNMRGDIAQALDDYTLALASDDTYHANLLKGRRSLVPDGSDRSSPTSSASTTMQQSGVSPDDTAASFAQASPRSAAAKGPSAPGSHSRETAARASTSAVLKSESSESHDHGGKDTDAVSDRNYRRPLKHGLKVVLAASCSPGPQPELKTAAGHVRAPTEPASHSTAQGAQCAHNLPRTDEDCSVGHALVPQAVCSPRLLPCEAIEGESQRARAAVVTCQQSSSGQAEALSASQCRLQVALQHLARACALRRQGKHAAAVQEYTFALAHCSDNFKALFNRGFTHDKLGDYAAAIRDYTAAISVESRSSVAYFNRAITKERLNDLDGALEDFTSAILLDPTSADALHNRGYAYRKAGKLEAAVSDYTQALAINPHHSRAYYNRGVAYDCLGRPDSALEDYSRSIELEPTNVTAFHSRGGLHQRLGRPLEALADFNSAIALDSSCAFIYNARGVLLQSLGQLAQALPDFDAAVSLAPASAAFMRNRGQCRRATGDVQGSIADFTVAVRLDPQDVVAHVQRAHSFRRIKEFEAAIKDYTTAMELGEHINTSLLNHRAYSLAKIGCYAEAVNDYNRVLEVDPDNAHARYNRTFGLEKLGLN